MCDLSGNQGPQEAFERFVVTGLKVCAVVAVGAGILTAMLLGLVFFYL